MCRLMEVWTAIDMQDPNRLSLDVRGDFLALS